MRLFQPDHLGVAVVYGESRGEPFEGKVAVGEVVRNRTKAKYFSNGDIASTVFWPKQFSSMNDDNHWRWMLFVLDDNDPVVRECFKAWTMSAKSTLAAHALLFCNLSLCHPNWAKDEDRVAVFGHHTFYLPGYGVKA